MKIRNLISKGEHKFYIPAACVQAIPQSKHLLYSEEVQKLVTRLDEGGRGLEFFHYTDAKPAIDAFGSADYAAIMKHQKTDHDTLSNASALGLYVASNPFSSASYGKYQVHMSFNPSARLLDFTVHGHDFWRIFKKTVLNVKELSRCPDNLAMSLFLEDNIIQIVRYDQKDSWFVVVDESIIRSARINLIEGDDRPTIIKKMLDQDDGAGLETSVSELGFDQGKHTAKLNELVSLRFLDKFISGPKKGMALKAIATTSGQDLKDLLRHYRKYLSEDDLFGVPFEGVSTDFKNSIFDLVKDDPEKQRKISQKNLAEGLVEGRIKMVHPLENGVLDEIFRFKVTKEKIVPFIQYILEKNLQYFIDKEASQQEDLLDVIVNYADPATWNSFHKMFEVSRPGFDGYIAKAKGLQLQKFVLDYIGRKKDPAILTRNFIGVFKGAIKNMLVPDVMTILTAKEKQLIFSALDNFSEVSLYISLFRPTIAEKAELVSFHGAKIERSILEQMLVELKSDSGVWENFTNPENEKGIFSLLDIAGHNSLVLPYVQELFDQKLNPLQRARVLARCSGRFYKIDALGKGITYTPEMTHAVTEELLRRTFEEVDLDRFFSIPSFVQHLSKADLKSVLDKLSYWSLGETSTLKTWPQENIALVILKTGTTLHYLDTMLSLFKFEKLSEAAKKDFVETYLKNESQISIFTKAAVFKDVIGWAIKNKYVPLFNHYLQDSLSVHSDFRFADIDYYAEVIRLNDKALTRKLLAQIEEHYPIDWTGSFPYISVIIDEYPRLRTNPLVKNHMENYICKKVSGINYFKRVIEAEKDDAKKARLKKKRKEYCDTFLWF